MRLSTRTSSTPVLFLCLESFLHEGPLTLSQDTCVSTSRALGLGAPRCVRSTTDAWWGRWVQKVFPLRVGVGPGRDLSRTRWAGPLSGRSRVRSRKRKDEIGFWCLVEAESVSSSSLPSPTGVGFHVVPVGWDVFVPVSLRGFSTGFYTGVFRCCLGLTWTRVPVLRDPDPYGFSQRNGGWY